MSLGKSFSQRLSISMNVNLTVVVRLNKTIPHVQVRYFAYFITDATYSSKPWVWIIAWMTLTKVTKYALATSSRVPDWTNILHHWTTGSLFLMLGCVNLDRKIAPSLELCRIRRGLRRGRTSAGRRRRGRGGRRSRSGGKRAAEAAAGTNCIKIVLPGKSIRGDYFQENVTSRRPFSYWESVFREDLFLCNCLQAILPLRFIFLFTLGKMYPSKVHLQRSLLQLLVALPLKQTSKRPVFIPIE